MSLSLLGNGEYSAGTEGGGGDGGCHNPGLDYGQHFMKTFCFLILNPKWGSER